MLTTYDKKRAIYRNSRGKEVSARPSIDALSADTRVRLRAITQKHLDGKLNFAGWATESEELIRKSLISSGQIAAGGKAQISNSINGRIGARVRFHLDKFRTFGREREQGKVSDAQMLSRIEMYGDAATSLFEQIRLGVMGDAGYKEAKRTLGTSENCDDCPPLAGKWVVLADVVAIGETQCLTRCRCTISYR